MCVCVPSHRQQLRKFPKKYIFLMLRYKACIKIIKYSYSVFKEETASQRKITLCFPKKKKSLYNKNQRDGNTGLKPN